MLTDIIKFVFILGAGTGVLAYCLMRDKKQKENTTNSDTEDEEEPEIKVNTLMVDSPVMFDDFVGQHKAKKIMRIHVGAAKIEKRAISHILLEGPGGTGKTTLATCAANEIDTKTYITTPSTFKDKDAVMNFFFEKDGTCKIKHGDVVFIDEIHRLREAAAIYIYSAMQDFYIDVGGSIAKIPEFTVIGATTDAGMLPGPFRDRFKVRITLDPYLTEDLSRIVVNYKKFPKPVADSIAQRGAGIPRIAKNITGHVTALATVSGLEVPTLATVEEMCDLLEIDELGISKSAKRIIKYLQDTENRAIGAASLSSALNLSRETVEQELYPVLFMQGLLMGKGTRGKCLTKKGMEYGV